MNKYPIERGARIDNGLGSKEVYETSHEDKLIKVIAHDILSHAQLGGHVWWKNLDQDERLAFLRQTYYLHKLVELIHPGFTARIFGVNAKESAYLVKKVRGEPQDNPQETKEVIEKLRQHRIHVDTIGQNNFVRVEVPEGEVYVDHLTTTRWQDAYNYCSTELRAMGGGRISKDTQDYLDNFSTYSKLVDEIFKAHNKR